MIDSLIQELVKHTPLDHPDHKPIKEAHLRMKDVCTGVNEARRQLEHLEKLEDLQNSISNWEVSNLDIFFVFESDFSNY